MGFEKLAGVARVLTAVQAATAVFTPSSLGKMKGIVEAPSVTAGPPATFIEAIVIFENIFFSQFLPRPSATPGNWLTAHSLRSFETQSAQSSLIFHLPLRGRQMESTFTRRAGGLNFRPLAEKPKAHQCFNRCTCNRVRSTRFVWQEITQPLRGKVIFE